MTAYAIPGVTPPPTPEQVVAAALSVHVPGRRGAQFQEWDLEAESLKPVDRDLGTQDSGIVAGVLTHWFAGHTGPVRRVWLAGDPRRAMGAVAQAECQRILAAIDLAQANGWTLEWVALSAGARISMDSGTENMDWCARVVRRLLEFTQAGGEVVVITVGANVGAQSYWNAVATMLNHTAGMLVMVEGSSMVLTGTRALAASGAQSEAHESLLGGYDAVMGPNGQSHHHADTLEQAYRLVLAHHELLAATRTPRFTCDPWDRDIRTAGYTGRLPFDTVGEVLDSAHNPGRKTAFEIRPVLTALRDADAPWLERWEDQAGADGAVVWDTRLGGQAVTLIGIESYHRASGGRTHLAATLYPAASKKIARALNHASGRRPVVVLANLAGFDGSAASLREQQLEFGAEIARAVVNFAGPIVVCIIGRFHGGAYVVFNKTLNDGLRMLALDGTKVSVIGGSAAAEVVLTRSVKQRIAAGMDPRAAAGAVAAEFDEVHNVDRALTVGSVDAVIGADSLRPALIAEIHAGLARARMVS